MLSYQHGYHAGNLADVHKHALLAAMLDYLTAKDKPLTYIETHAGRALYDLGAPEAVKTGEAAAGILRAERDGWFAPDHPYMHALARVRAERGTSTYPGSPLIAASLLRSGDRMHLAELHPQEYAALAYAMGPCDATLHHRDGYQMALALTPPTPRRGLMLIDPSYEVKADYDTLPRLIAQVHAKWNVGCIALWYPILPGGAHGPMLTALTAADLPKVLWHEVRFRPLRDGKGLIGSGMFVVNAPFGSRQEADELSRMFASI
jgi:23S rRNA (adenine2030-N6)-methyltransferase